MKIIGTLCLTLLITLACGKSDIQAQRTSTTIDNNYNLYGELLSNYVNDGLVDYKSLKNSRAILDSVVAVLESASLEGLTQNQKLAFYINTYNLITLRSIVDAYPVKSIKDIKGVWDKKKWIVSGEKLTLNDIEHEILRKDFDEPRIHFAIVCASIGCPPLSSTPFLPDSLESQFADVARNFARSADYNQLDPDNNLASLSSIFDWFGEDFISKYYDDSVFKNLSKKENAALNFIIANYPDTTREKLKQTEFKIKYLDYDWSLNDLR